MLESEQLKNGEGRVFPMTDDLRALLEAQHAEHMRLKRAGQIIPSVFFRLMADTRGGPTRPKPVLAFTTRWLKKFGGAARI